MTLPAGPARLGRIPLPKPLREARNAWARSLLLRVVSTTLVLSLVVVVAVGAILLNRIRDGLLDAKVNASIAEASAGRDTAQRLADASDNIQSPAAAQLVDQIAWRAAPDRQAFTRCCCCRRPAPRPHHNAVRQW
jgi:two-component system, OmpR family, sensor histidine kinase MtrB